MSFPLIVGLRLPAVPVVARRWRPFHCDPEARLVVGEFDRDAVQAGDGRNQAQSEPVSGCCPARFESVETTKDVFVLGRRYARPGIGQDYCGFVVVDPRSKANDGALGRVAQRVLKQVCEHLASSSRSPKVVRPAGMSAEKFWCFSSAIV